MRLPLLAALILVAGCSNEPNPVDITVRRLSVGATTACALDPSDKVYCWGLNSSLLEYGSSSLPTSNIPVSVNITVASLGSGWGQHKCALRSGVNTAECWGRAESGQIGDGTFTNAGVGKTPANVVSTEKWVDISAGRLISCALSTGGDGYCWGRNQSGELGDTSLARPFTQAVPLKVTGGIKFSSIVAGWTNSCGIATDGVAYCWGNNKSGTLGIGSSDTNSAAAVVPTPLATSAHFKKLALSARSGCGITTDSQLLCWGYNALGQLGDGTTLTRISPTPVALNKKWKDVAMSTGIVEGTSATAPTGLLQAGTAFTCAIDDSDAVYCWGWNGAGQLGDGTVSDRLTPVAVSTTLKFKSIALGSAYSCGESGTAIYCWGSNSYGQLGGGTLSDAFAPVKVQTPW